MDAILREAIRRAAEAAAGARALVVAAGAGMGVDSGLPDFRGDVGFWRAYPPYAKLGLRFQDLASPRWFRRDPTLAWGFYGHRLELYRATRPHAGFDVLRRLGDALPHGAFVFTSNVDGQFQRAGFPDDRIVECHGSIHYAQCTATCGIGIFPADEFRVDVDPDSFRARPPLPACPKCGALARPNVLMFGDWDWDHARTGAQDARFDAWLASLGPDAKGRLLVIECGAGRAIPTVRDTSERLARASGGLLVRINVREPDVPEGHVALPIPALAALRALEPALSPSRVQPHSVEGEHHGTRRARRGGE